MPATESGVAATSDAILSRIKPECKRLTRRRRSAGPVRWLPQSSQVATFHPACVAKCQTTLLPLVTTAVGPSEQLPLRENNRNWPAAFKPISTIAVELLFVRSGRSFGLYFLNT